MFCTKCGKQVGGEDKFCWHCGYKLEKKEIHVHVLLPRKTPPTSYSIQQRKAVGKETVPRVLLIVLLFIGVIFLIWFLVGIPRDEIIEIGNSNYVLSKEAQKYLMILDKSDYEKQKSVVIIQEPHDDLKQQYNLYKGLEIFFNDNSALINETIFLSEGFPSGKRISVQPLIAANASPNEELIREILGSYLITGYIAYEWKYQKRIPIIGTENEKLYELSTRKWIDVQENQDDQNISDIWTYTVVARNGNIANLLIETTEICENPILFIGGLHLYQQNDDDFQRIKNNSISLAADDLQYLEGWENSGIHDYLKKEKIGYTFIQARSNSFESRGQSEKNYNTYIKLFETQQSGDYNSYIRWFISERGLDGGVTVRPSIKAAAALINALSKNNKDEKKDENKDKKNEKDGDKDGRTGDGEGKDGIREDNKDGGDKSKPREATRNGKAGLEEGKEISEGEAAERVRNGEDVKANSQEQAETIAREAGGGKDPIPEAAHRNGQYDHYHTGNHGKGHVFFGSQVYYN